MRLKQYILTFVAVMLACTVYADNVTTVADSIQTAVPEETTDTEEAFNAKDVIFSHIGDAYEYHITEINGHPISVPLLVIVKSAERGWFAFCSNKVAHGQQYEGFYIQKGGDYDGKIVEVNSEGQVVRPFDISITRNVFALLLSSLILILIS